MMQRVSPLLQVYALTVWLVIENSPMFPLTGKLENWKCPDGKVSHHLRPPCLRSRIHGPRQTGYARRSYQIITLHSQRDMRK